MPIEKQLTEAQALKLIGDVCRNRMTDVALAEKLVNESYAKPLTDSRDLLVTLDRRVVEGLTSALKLCLDVSDTKVTLG